MTDASRGITVIGVDDAARLIRFLVGNIDLMLEYLPEQDTFRTVFRSFVDGTRTTAAARVPDAQFSRLLRQAHGIARSHGWKCA